MQNRARLATVSSTVVLVATVTALAVTGRGGAGVATTAASPSTGAGRASGSVTVFAAASLTGSFTTIGKDFEAASPGAKVTFNFAGSSALAMQINQGAPADVFASASPTNMKTVTDAGGVEGVPVTFVRNQLVIVVPKGNPRHLAGLPDLARGDLKVALCAEQVPCGAAARKVLAAANIALTPVTREPDVKAALSKVRLGEADAALVYRTDAKAAVSDAEGVEFPESAQAINEYPIAVLAEAPNKRAATAFVEYVRSSKGLRVLTAAGFQEP